MVNLLTFGGRLAALSIAILLSLSTFGLAMQGGLVAPEENVDEEPAHLPGQDPVVVPMSHNGDEDHDGIPDALEAVLCTVEDETTDTDGTCADGTDYTPPTALPVLPEDPTDLDAMGEFAQDGILSGMHTIALLVNVIGETQSAPGLPTEQQFGYSRMYAAEADFDEDGRPDYFILETGTDRDCDLQDPEQVPGEPGECPVPAQHSAVQYVQSDYIYGPASDRLAMIVDPNDGTTTVVGIDVTQQEAGLVITVLDETGAFAKITIDANDQRDTLVLEVLDDQARYFYPMPAYPGVGPNAGIGPFSWGSPIYHTVPFDLHYVVLLMHGDLDGDNKPDLDELMARSHPVNPASTPANLDGDACPNSSDPDMHDPNVCAIFPYELYINTPDSSPLDAFERTVYGDATFTFGAIALPDVENPVAIDSWQLKIFEFDDVSGHDSNATLEAEGYPERCDLLPTDPPSQVSNPEEGEHYDGDPPEHNHCEYLRDPSYTESNGHIADNRAIVLCEGIGLGTVQTCTYDTTQLIDMSEAHLFVEACLVGEDCQALVGSGTDVVDHFGVSEHFAIANKPALEVHDVIDVDGVMDRDDKLSDHVQINITTTHLLGHPIEEVTVEQVTERPGDSSPTQVGTKKVWTFDVLDLSETGSVTDRNATITLVDALNGDYEIVLDSNEFDQDHRQYGAQFTVMSRATVGPVNEAPEFPSSTSYVEFFNNRAPGLSGLTVESNGKEPADNVTSVTFGFHYTDQDQLSTAPELHIDVTHVESGATSRTSDCTKVPLPATDVLGSNPNHDADYTCTWQTPLSGDFTWAVSATDADRGDNTTVEVAENAVDVADLATSLSDGRAEAQPRSPFDSDPRSEFELRVRYADEDDDASSVTATIVNTEDGATEVVDLDLCAVSTTSPTDNPPAPNQGDYCALVRFAEGDYEITFTSRTVRNVTTEDGPIDLRALADVAFCPQCGSDDDVIRQLREAMLQSVSTLNAALEEAPGVPPLNGQSVTCPSCDPADDDSDGDGDSDSEEQGAGSDPQNPHSTQGDTDADLVPNAVDDYLLAVDVMALDKDGKITVTEAPAVRMLNPLAGEPPVFEVVLNEEEGGYHMTLNGVPNGPATVRGLGNLHYEITQTGIVLYAMHPQGFEAFRLEIDESLIGLPGEDFIVLETRTNNVIYNNVYVSTNPFNVRTDSNNAALDEMSLQDELAGSPLCQTIGEANCTIGFYRDENGTAQPYLGEPGSVPGLPGAPDPSELIPDDPVQPPQGLDDDGDGVPDDVEPSLCRYNNPEGPLAEPDGTCEGDDYTPYDPAGA